jgi:hypothetical protein
MQVCLRAHDAQDAELARRIARLTPSEPPQPTG